MHPEIQYLDLIERILRDGYFRPSPHQPLPNQPEPPGTFTLVNENLKFDLSGGDFPLMTVRGLPKNAFRAAVGEMLWYLSGSTDNHDLQAQGIKVWDPWDTPDTNQSLGWDPGQLGPIYGKQWRHWGADMLKPDGQLAGRGYDQIAALLDGLLNRPHSKRNYVTAYDPRDMEDCFVTTCHGLFFCYVFGGRLDMHTVQRSGDTPVGVPFNIASYSLLLLMLAQVSGLLPGTLHHTISDAHIYGNQREAMWQLLGRDPQPYPRVIINPGITNIFDFTIDDFELVGYEPHPAIAVPVST